MPSKLSSVAREAARDEHGTVAILFGLLLVVALFLSGLAIDFSRTSDAESRLQSALDAAVLAASSEATADENRQAVFDKVFAENFEGTPKPTTTYSYTMGLGGKGKALFALNTTLLAAVGYKKLDIAVESVAGQAGFDIEVALVLDVSGSMRASMSGSTRLAALKKSAKALVNTLEQEKSPNQRIRYAIIPFTMNVNVGTANSAFVTGTSHELFNGTEWAGCVLERPGSYANDDTYTTGGPGSGGKWHAYVWPPEPNSNNRCTNPSNGTNTGYATVQTIVGGDAYNPWTKGPNYNCVRHPIVPLTSSSSDIIREIDNLTSHSNMGTIAAPGIAWGHRVLSPSEPFTEGEAFSGAVRKIMVVITDGEQTTEGPYQGGECTNATNTSASYSFDPATFDLKGSPLATKGPRDMFSPYGYMKDSNPGGSGTASWSEVESQMESLTLDACKNFKQRETSPGMVHLYTIAASKGAGPGTKVYKLLQSCATDSEHFFYADSASSLEEAFTSIAKASKSLRLTQ